LSEEGMLTELIVHYPFTPHSRRLFEKLPIEESFNSMEVVKQAEIRLLSCIGRARYERHIAELIEFLSFFVSAIVAAQDPYLNNKFANKESELARNFFVNDSDNKSLIMQECFGFKLIRVDDKTTAYRFLTRVEEYLTFVTKFELHKLGKWKLVNQALSNGLVYFTENSVNDLFGDMAKRMIYDGVKNLRRAKFPSQLIELKEKILRYLPPPKVKSAKGYLYIEELMKHPVSDGRQRLVWLVLAPYLVNVKKVEEGEAIEAIRNYISTTGERLSMKRIIEYNVRRARRQGLMPPTLKTLKTAHPDLCMLLPKEVVAKYS
jgi:hypothetical protein